MIKKQYKIGDKIGGELSVIDIFGGETKSGMGVVYLVEDRETSFPYVLKTFQQKTGTEGSKQFIAEAHAWIQSGVHENLVKAFWVREIDEQLFIAAEYIDYDEEGRNTLTSYIKIGQLKDSVILNWAAQFCYGMLYALSKGVLCHRDIKPDNLMIASDGILKITDFGLAKAVVMESVEEDDTKKGWWLFGKKNKKSQNTASMTQTGSTMGTPPYMAPEQFINSKNVDFRADIYSLGIILYEMVTGGGYPYKQLKELSQNPILNFAKLHIQAQVIPFQSPLMHIIQKCLKKRREDRYKTYEALLQDIQQLAKMHNIKIIPPPIVGISEDEELYSKAQSYIALKQPKKAYDAIKSYVTKFPDRFCGWTEKSKIHLDLNEIDQAISTAKHSIALFPYNSHAWNNLGVALRRQGQNLKEARIALESAIEYDRGNSGAMMNLSILLQKNSEWEQIPKLLTTALEFRPEKEVLRFNAGNIAAAMVKENKLIEAKIVLEALIKAAPDDQNALHNLALINWQEGEPQKAIKGFEHVVKLNPKDDFAWLSLAKLYFRMKKAKETIRCCNKLLKLRKSVSAAVSMASQVMNMTGNYPGAVELLEGYLQNQPENDMWWFILSEIHEYRDNQEDALKAAIKCKNILEKYQHNIDPDNLQQVENKIQRLSQK